MSGVKIKAAAGGGSTELQGPANTGNNTVLKLPSADGSANQLLKTDGSGNFGWGTGGKILQVIQSTKSNESAIATNSTSWTDVPGTDEEGNGSIWEVNITPTSANSKILVEFTGALGGNNFVAGTLRLVREIADSSATAVGIGDAKGSQQRTSRLIRDDQTAMKVHAIHQSHILYLDSPNTTSKVTYHLEGHAYNTSSTIYINRSGGVQTETYYDDVQSSTLLVMEVAG